MFLINPNLFPTLRSLHKIHTSDFLHITEFTSEFTHSNKKNRFMECSAYTRQGLPEVFQKAVSQATAAAQAKRDTAVNTGHSRCVVL